MNTEKLYINSESRSGKAGVYEVTSPLDGKVVSRVAAASVEDLQEAVATAKCCQETLWGKLSRKERAAHLYKVADVLETHAPAMAEAMCRETGLWYGDQWIPAQGAYFRYYADMMLGKSPRLQRGSAQLVEEPIGVCGTIIPWNTTVHGLALKAAPALAAGNTVVALPPEEAPTSVLMMAQVFDEAGLPAGACNLLAGNGATLGQALVEHPDVRMISFTGSVAVGRQIMRTAAGNFKRLVLELGGKSPLILFGDVDVDKAAECAMSCAFGNQGQACCAVSRVLVHRSILDGFLKRIREIATQFAPAWPRESDKPWAVGPVFNKRSLERVQQYVEIGKNEGDLLFGGNRYTDEHFANGFFHEPTAFLLANGKGRLATEEVFGPVLSVIPFDSEDEAVAIANAVDFGLSASVWSADDALLERVVPRIQAGTVWVNAYNQFGIEEPWGGFKQSGFGKEGGPEGLEPYLQRKAIWWNCGEVS